ncbi:hypothetical protein C0995_006928 [Termitomyces sp. Mi166|nr:hypothetical protein C0995_006928 [Termitomyces sp. Mi166\
MALRAPTKRARSPGSPDDRPNKRLSLAIDRFRLAHSSGNVTPQSPASSSRFPSEDWVQQTDGLTIDSPVIVDSRIAEERDEDMNMDSEEIILVEPPTHPQRPALPPIQTTQMNFAHAPLFRQHHHQHTPISTASSTPTPPGPLVTVLPPTPSISTSSAPYIDASSMRTQTQTPTRPSTPVDNTASDSPMVLSSPKGSFTAPAPRKQRFTMGPRADCIKCQMNMKGHSFNPKSLEPPAREYVVGHPPAGFGLNRTLILSEETIGAWRKLVEHPSCASEGKEAWTSL